LTFRDIAGDDLACFQKASVDKLSPGRRVLRLSELEKIKELKLANQGGALLASQPHLGATLEGSHWQE
jgi:hypothetical protein